MPFATAWMDLRILILSEVSQTMKDQHHIIPLVCGILKKDTNELICKTKTDSHTVKNYGDKGGQGEGWTEGLGLAYAH